jgi:hypothetical protein
MSTRINIILCLVLLSVCVPNASAQKRRARTAAAPARATAKPTWNILTEPGPEDDNITSVVKLEPLPMASVPPQAKTQAQVLAGFTLSGTPPAQPKFVTLTFLSRAAACRFSKAANFYGEFKTDLRLLLDGKLLPLTYQAVSDPNGFRERMPETEGVWWGTQELEGGVCAETVVASVSPQTFARLTAARSVAVKIGATTFNLDATHLNAFRDLARRLPTTH